MNGVTSTAKIEKRASSQRTMRDSVASPSKRQRQQQRVHDETYDQAVSVQEVATSSNTSSGTQPEPNHETIELDDTCPICHLLLTQPVRTTCNHILCEPCMAHWADVSIFTQTTRISLDDETEPEALIPPPNEIETKCPMCRTLTVARPDLVLEANLRQRYPQSYTARASETDNNIDGEDGTFVETLTLLIGNEHRLLTTSERESSRHSDSNEHEWKFFIRPSPATTTLIEEVHIFLHPTFRSPRVIVQYPPYEIRRVGWGTFTIEFNIILRAGYSWLSTQAEDTVDGGRKGKLPLEWRLDFEGRGSQMRMRLKVRRERGGTEESGAERLMREQTSRVWMAQRRGDPDYVPPPDL